MKLANNPFTDDPIEHDRKQYCGKCYKLDRTQHLCESYNLKLFMVRGGKFPVYEKCDECKKSVA